MKVRGRLSASPVTRQKNQQKERTKMYMIELVDELRNREMPDWTNAEHPLDVLTRVAFGILRLSCESMPCDAIEDPIIRSLVTCVAASSLRDALDTYDRGQLGEAFAIAEERASTVGRMLMTQEPSEVRRVVFAQNGVDLA